LRIKGVEKMAEVKILSQYCKGCGFCVKSCPKKVLEVTQEVNMLGYKYVSPIHVQDCIACKMCAVICPDAAVEIYLPTLSEEEKVS